MNFESIAAVLFLVILSLVVFFNRKKLGIQKLLFPVFYFVMYRTKFGLKAMDSFAMRFKRILKPLGYLVIFIGFGGMLFIAFSLIQNVYKMLTVPTAIPGVGLVLPFQVKGAFFVPFFYWIISIFILAVVHEGFHGVYSRLWGLKIKSSGLAALAVFIPVLPVAFVEPDERKLKKAGLKEQLSIYSAGPFSNIVLAMVVLGIFALIAAPVVNAIVEFNGVEITGLIENPENPYPAELAGIEKGEIITQVNDISITTVENFTSILMDKKPNEEITVTTNKGTYTMKLGVNPDDVTKGYMGVQVQQSQKIKDSAKERLWILPKVILWFFGLLYWLFVLNLGIGLFNLVPLGPIDGGRMLNAVLQKYFPKEQAKKIFSFVSMMFLLLIFLNLVFPYIKGLLV